MPFRASLRAVHNGVLFVAGGSSFPVSPWQGGKKYWHTKVYALYDNRQPETWGAQASLVRPRAYGASISHDSGIYLVGGSFGDGHYDDTRWLWFDGEELHVETLEAKLPVALAYHGGALIGNTIYVVGGQEGPKATTASDALYALDLSDMEAGWRTLDTPLPGGGRILPGVAAANGKLHVISGAALHAGDDGSPARTYLSDHWVYAPGEGWTEAAAIERPVVAAACVAPGTGPIYIFGGDDGKNASRTSELGDDHPGFDGEVLAYYPVLGTWSRMGSMRESVVTTTAVEYNGKIVIPAGEDRPGHRSTGVYAGSVRKPEFGLSMIDYLAILLYLGALVAMGWYFSRGENDTERFFLGGRRIPWWAVGISIFGTSLSAITYLSIPARAFATDWTMVFANASMFVVTPIVVWLYIPRFREAPITTAYEYLEQRFHPIIRVYGSLCFLLFQAGRISIVLLLPAIALNTATGMDIGLCIVAMGVLATVYTALGGIEAVIWSDVMQAVVLVTGAVLALGLVVTSVEGGWSGMIAAATEADKFQLANPTWSYAAESLWVIFLGNIFLTFYPTTADQTVVQRYLTTVDAKSAGRAALTNMWLTLPITLLFFTLGTALWAYFRENAALLQPGMKNDAILPLFIMAEFPAGLRGVIIAGIFAAAMSSLDSSINSIASVLVNDYYKRYIDQGVNEKTGLMLARVVTVFMGVLGTACAWAMAEMNAVSLWDPFLQLLGLAGGGLAGLFALGVLTQRGNGSGAIVGAVCSMVILFVCKAFTDVHPFLYGAIGFLSALGIGYAASLALPKERTAG